ncbi:MAG: prepilin-type N-terminal cleavage/methylation domain-containing protein [Elusimicrobiota bacterium]|jgi:prepilin-type N-terminal cleavage/methylation domain-containing protein|nr:prepilin-type N-terminal cleavage/methylation domain-containing protein [Elusimicrobiota bacterium]
MTKNNKGFTMMEIMVVVILIAILTAFAVPQYMKVTEQQRGVEALNILAAIGKAEERYFAINEAYTEDFSDLDLDLTNSSATTYSNKAFNFVLSGTTDAAGKVTATRATGKYSLERKHSTSEVCCKSLSGDDGTELCEIFGDVDICSP